jgi:hypothetical protein
MRLVLKLAFAALVVGVTSVAAQAQPYDGHRPPPRHYYHRHHYHRPPPPPRFHHDDRR